MQEREMAHHNRNIGFFSMIAGCPCRKLNLTSS